jgi:hypothetical protein
MSLLLASLAPGFDPAVQAHLLEAVDTLRAETPVHLDAEQRRARRDALATLEAYALAGEFPEHGGSALTPRSVLPPRVFDDGTPRMPVFIDDDGSHCAVGYLVAADDPELADTVADVANDAWLLEMDLPALGDWATAHGFTLDELAWIQPSYRMALRECGTFAPGELPPGTTGGCSGIDVATLDADWGQRLACLQGCGPGVQVWVPVHNVGDTTAERGRLVARSPAGDEVVAPMPPVVAGEIRWVGPITVPADTLVSYVVTVEADGDCDDTNNAFELARPFELTTMNGGGNVYLDADGDGVKSAECGGRDCDDADPEVRYNLCGDSGVGAPTCEACEDEASSGTGASPGCGCAAGGAGGGWLLLLPLVARRRR